MLEPYTTAVLRGGAGHQRADRDRGAAPDCRTAELYAIEAEVRGQSPAHRLAARHNRSKPVVDAIRLWFEAQLPIVPGRSTLAEAIRYALSRWEGLTRFLHDGRVELDTNPVERAISARRLVEFKDGCRYGKFGKTKAYELIAEERIRAYKMGGKTLIDLDSVDEYHASLPRV
jgi:excisionase family DNA binding protein